MNKNWLALSNEVAFARSTLGLGVTQIQYANYAELGVYWQSFTNLSVGLERLAKLVIVLDYLHHHGNYPDFQTLRNYGHDLNKLYTISKQIVLNNNIKFDFIDNLDSEIHINILTILSNFAKGDRYANLDFLTGMNDKNPVSDWSLKVDNWIWENKISQKKKAKIISLYENSYTAIRPSICFHITETNQEITSIKELSKLETKTSMIIPYRKLYIVQIIRYWVEILLWLQNLCYSKCVPDFREDFPLFLQKDDYIKRRKNWTKRY